MMRFIAAQLLTLTVVLSSAAQPHLDQTACPEPAEGARLPNFLFIAIDDLRPELGCYGAEHIHSPHIDRLAEEGVQFNRAYCQVAVCNPSRVSLLTGLRPDSSRVWTLDVRFRHTVPDVLTLPAHFKANGYNTIGFGKIFHNPWPDNESWSEPHGWPKHSKLWSDDAKKRHREFREQMRADGKSDAAITRMRAPATEKVDYSPREHIDEAIARQAVAAMRELAEAQGSPEPRAKGASAGPDSDPFFLAVGFVRPHLPFVVPRQYWDLYDPESIELATQTTFPKNYPVGVPAMNTMYELRDYMDYADTPPAGKGLLTPAQQRELRHGYYASVSYIDFLVGLLLDELDDLDLTDNTIVVLWSDHGFKLGEYGSWCKQTNYEIDARVPLIIRSPKHLETKRREAATSARPASDSRGTLALVELLDVYPTLCELAGIPIPDHTEGTSLVPVLENPKSSVKEAAFSQFTRRLNDKRFMGYAMRTNTHRYIEWIDRQTKESVATELYDHRKDPHETTNVASNPKNKELLTQLHNQLWTALPDPPDFKPATPKKQRPQLRFENNLNEPVTVFWLRPDGPRRESGQIAPGKSLTSNTTLGHRFLIKGTQSDFTQTVTVTKQNETVSLAALKKKATKAQSGEASRFPNILILMADDWSYPHAAALGDPTVHTPTFDRIAREGALFENAFVSAPSCTPSRHAVSSGQYHWRPGVGADLGSSMAAHIPVYPDLLADAGYITGFSRKGTGPSKHTHRGNDPFGPKFESFEAFYHQRDPFQPFCFWYGAGEPHRPYRLGEGIEKGIDLASIVIPPGLPDNETVRSDLADYYARVQRFDADAARMIALLEEAGELENTIVVMTGDNGMPFPRCKGTLYDMGTRVPLAIRWGAHLKNPGRTISGFTSLTDLAPTFLEAAKLDGPAEMTGQSLMPTLLGAQSTSRDFVLTGLESHVYPRPRRALRTEDFLLIRNFSPKDWPTGEVKGKQPRYNFNETPWPTTPGAFSFAADPGPTKQWMLHHRDGPEAEHHYQLAFGSPPEWELYDLKEDPGQLHNVADHPDYKSQFQILRQQLAEGLQASGDSRRIDGNTEATWERRTQNLKGWTIYSNESLWQNNPDVMKRAMEIISLQLDRVLDTVPPAALKKLQEVPLYINPPYPETRGKAEYHPHAGWLRKNNRDPAMAKAVEFTNARILPFENKRMPYVVLHELAHAYHDQVLGFDHPEIKAAYERAKNSGTYNQVKRWTGTEETIDKAYAMSTPQEYFAESTEAFFGKNDFYPFTREELKKHDPAIHDLLDKLWNSTHTSGNDR